MIGRWYHPVAVSRVLTLILIAAPFLLACLGGCFGSDRTGQTGRVSQTNQTSQARPTDLENSKQDAPPSGYNPARRTQLAELPKAEVRIGSHVMPVWVAANSLTREEGMMHLTDAEVPEDHGMLFVFLEEAPLSFWMRNTLIPLDIAFLDAKGQVLNTERMRPRDPTPIPSKGPAKYALEAKAGAFDRLGIRPGKTIQLPPGLSAID